MSGDKEPIYCPECGLPMLRNGVILVGNILTQTPPKPCWRWDCPSCEVMLADDDIDEAEGWTLWEQQNAKN